MSKERWVHVPGTKDYAVSDRGVVARTTEGERGVAPKNMIMSQQVHQGQMRVCLYIDGKYKNFRVDALVLEAFGKPRPNRTYTPSHADGNPENCCLSNLSWARRGTHK